MKLCCVDGCENESWAKALCLKHYKRFVRTGQIVQGSRPRGSLFERFWAKVDKRGDGDCWPWTGAKTSKGYGAIQQCGKGSPMLLAHRASYEFSAGPIESGLYILHSCDNPGCVNPAHLRAGTQSENIAEAFAKGRKLIPQEIRRRKALAAQ